MKTNKMRPSTLILFCLTVLSCVRCAEVTVTGYEGGTAVIDCPFQEDHKSKPKYLKKGLDSNSTKLIQSNGHDEWTHRGRVSLQDRKNRSIFTVTIHNLTPEDAGEYVCGVEGWFNDFTTLVNVTVVTTPTHTATSSPLSDLTAMENTALFKTNHTSATSGQPVYVSVGLTAALVLSSVLILIFILVKKNRVVCSSSAHQSSARATFRHSGEETADYENDAHDPTIQMSSTYQSLNPNTTQLETDYQNLNPNTTQPDADYQSLNPNTTQPDAVYQSLNPNTTQPDAVYQSLNPNTTQPDAVYQSLNPNTTQPDAVYQSLNPNTIVHHSA